MDVGSKVKYENNGKTFYGVIVGKSIPKCKCKGKSKWFVNFGGFTREINETDKNLVEDNGDITPNTNDLNFKF